MDITIRPGRLSGEISIIPSKSQAHRFLICAAFADGPTTLICPDTNRDIEATAQCLQALGASIVRDKLGYNVHPIKRIPDRCELYCQDSGSTLRFLLPIAGALGVDTIFHMTGRLPQRPLSPLWEEMGRMGCQLSRPTPNTIRCQGKLKSGDYSMDGSISSQFITGLLLALPLIPGESKLQLIGKIESVPYIQLTQSVMANFEIDTRNYHIHDGIYHTPGTVAVEGDWSNGAFFLAANSLGNAVHITNLNESSVQGDRAVRQILPMLNENITIDASDIPDLVPILSIVAACKKGAIFKNIQRLRLKESDRVSSVVEMVKSLGGNAISTDTTLTVYGTGLHGGVVDSKNDHRIAMSAAIAATICPSPVTILDAQSIEKSYPCFWGEYTRLGGVYEQHLR